MRHVLPRQLPLEPPTMGAATMEPELPVGQRIREHRERQGKSQAVVAGLCRITEDYLSRIERGKKTPSCPS
jgi:ribosome-binding protein aMBF1 (putative translation factor)